MGIFSQDKTTTNQTAYNEQVVSSTRDVNGLQVTGGRAATAGLIAAGQGAKVTINSNLDATALSASANSINNAIAGVTQIAQTALQSFQGASSVASESPTGPPGAAQSYPVDSAPAAGPVGWIEQHIFFAVGVVGVVLLVGYLRKKGKL